MPDSQAKPPRLSRDSPVDQRIDTSLAVQGFHRHVDFAVEGFGIGKCLMGQIMRLEIAPDNLDVIEFRRVFGQPLDGEPMLARIERQISAVSMAPSEPGQEVVRLSWPNHRVVI